MNVEFDLTVVMPIYNEEAGLRRCLESWLETLDRLDLSYRLLAIDDGSTDGTAAVIEELAEGRRIEPIIKANEGHGPTILRGYSQAVRESEWVFQTDSDDEIPATAFPSLWSARVGADAVLGRRVGREQSLGRKVLSALARRTVYVAFGSRVADVNVPFRLMRSAVLAPILAEIPPTTFAPNLVITGALCRRGTVVVEVDVPHTERTAGTVSIAGFGALRAAARSFWQSVRLARRFR